MLAPAEPVFNVTTASNALNGRPRLRRGACVCLFFHRCSVPRRSPHLRFLIAKVRTFPSARRTVTSRCAKRDAFAGSTWGAANFLVDLLAHQPLIPGLVINLTRIINRRVLHFDDCLRFERLDKCLSRSPDQSSSSMRAFWSAAKPVRTSVS